MKKTFGYHILTCFTFIIQVIPLRVHYILSEFLYFLIYNVVRYRKEVVFNNLRNSFPHKTDKEIVQLAKGFYHHFTDMFVETMYFANTSKKKIQKRITYRNIELIDDLYAKGKSIVVVMAHYNNWEWTSFAANVLKYKAYFIYQELHSKTFDLFYKNVRSRWGASLIERKETARTLIGKKRNNEPFMVFFLSDQSPGRKSGGHWTTFLNQDTLVFLGAEKIAKKTDAAVVFMEVNKNGRGKYVFSFDLIEEDVRNSAKFNITEQHVSRLEKMIKENPQYWLWSHRRWKHKRDN